MFILGLNGMGLNLLSCPSPLSSRAGEIIGGHQAVPHSRPYMAIIERELPSKKASFCDGFLLNKEFVMTAAHCQARSYKVFLGVHNFHHRNGVQEISSEEAYIHGNFINTDTVFKNDIMLIKLPTKAIFNKGVQPIDLPDPGSLSRPKSCLVSGWGKTSLTAKHQSGVLMEVNVTVTDRQCPMEHSYCCDGESGPYRGDSGGPLVCEDGKAYGVVSAFFTPHSGDPSINIFTKISDYASWINSTMKGLVFLYIL
uniref:trypsin n=1 Tax=Mola mola TaxID=94237 RepID=A0A3Q4AAS5_MOLML